MNCRWKLPHSSGTILIADLVLISVCAACESKGTADQIRISSKWRGWGSAESALLITRQGDDYRAGGILVPAGAVQSVIQTVMSPPLKSLNLENLGITDQRLDRIGKTALQRFQSASGLTLDGQEQARFLASFKNERLVCQGLNNAILPHTDDFPEMSVNIRLANGEQIRIVSQSQYYFMLPWVIERKGEVTRTYNADVSRALNRILPVNFTNRAKLSGEGLDDIVSWYVTEYNTKIIAGRP